MTLLHYFTIVKLKQSSALFHIYLDEKLEESLSDGILFDFKGLINSVEVTDFPIHDHKVMVVLRNVAGQIPVLVRVSSCLWA